VHFVTNPSKYKSLVLTKLSAVPDISLNHAYNGNDRHTRRHLLPKPRNDLQDAEGGWSRYLIDRNPDAADHGSTSDSSYVQEGAPVGSISRPVGVRIPDNRQCSRTADRHETHDMSEKTSCQPYEMQATGPNYPIQYERRSRHKTRKDLYDQKSPRKKENDVSSKSRPTASKRVKKSTKNGAALLREFESEIVSKDRLTVRSTYSDTPHEVCLLTMAVTSVAHCGLVQKRPCLSAI
jgi:hypothetical protein